MKTYSAILLSVYLSLITNEGYAIEIDTNTGPGLIYATPYVHVFYSKATRDWEDDNNSLYEAVYDIRSEEWTDKGKVGNAKTIAEPNLASRNEVFVVGHDNFKLWRIKRRNQEWETPNYIDKTIGDDLVISYSPFSPDVILWDWETISPPHRQHQEPTVVFTGIDNKLYIQSHRDPTHPPSSLEYTWRRAKALPDDISSNSAPTAYMIEGKFGVFYQGRGEGLDAVQIRFAKRNNDNIEYSEEWEVGEVKKAFTNKKIAVTRYSGNFDSMLIAYKSPYDTKINLALHDPEEGSVFESASWKRLGSIQGLATNESPALDSGIGLDDDGTRVFYLAFKPVDDTEICVGRLVVNERNGPDVAGHRFINIRQDNIPRGCPVERLFEGTPPPTE